MMPWLYYPDGVPVWLQVIGWLLAFVEPVALVLILTAIVRRRKAGKK